MTSFLDRLRGRPAPHYAKAVTSLAPWDRGVPLTSLTDTPQKRAEACLKAYKVGWFYKGGRKIADSISTLDWSISDGDAEAGQSENELERPDLDIPFATLAPIDQLQRLLERPNPYQTGRQLFQKTQIRLDFAGTAFWYLEGVTGGLPTGIYGISPPRMTPSYARDGTLLGWVMDIDKPDGGTPFDASEVLVFSTGSADDEPWGVGVVEAVYAEVPLTNLMARHTADVLTTGGRLAGMLSPKDRALTEDEFLDAQRAWRNVTSDPNAGRRLLLFPEPMEYTAGASTPAEIGIPELAALNRDNILTAFPISPYQLGVPMPGGLNSGETRREDRRDYWEGTIAPRVELLKETIQTGLVSIYELAVGQTFDFDLAIPNLDDAAALTAKATAFKDLVGIGLDPNEALAAAGLDHIKFLGLPELIDPAAQAQAQQEARQAQTDRLQQMNDNPMPAKADKREDLADYAIGLLSDFFDGQRVRVESRLRDLFPAGKRAKAMPDDWWGDEDAELEAVMREVYSRAGRISLQSVADQLDRIVLKPQVKHVLTDLLTHGGARITDINERTRDAIALELSEGIRRGYSISQLIDGVPTEDYKGVTGAALDNGLSVWSDARAETIARTETALSQNRAALTSYDTFGVKEVQAIDGDEDPECAERNGQTFGLDDALAIEDHPNGTLDWIPVIPDKSAHSVKVDVGSPVFNLHMPENVINFPELKTPTVTVEPAVVNVTTPEVYVAPAVVNVTTPEQQVNVNVPEQAAPIVNVSPPEIKIAPTVVNVPAQKAPVVNVTTPEVTVKNQVDAPVVNVRNDVQTPNVTVRNDVKTPEVKVTNEVKAPEVTVQTPGTIRIEAMPDRITKRVVERDKQGRITETTDVETDG